MRQMSQGLAIQARCRRMERKSVLQGSRHGIAFGSGAHNSSPGWLVARHRGEQCEQPARKVRQCLQKVHPDPEVTLECKNLGLGFFQPDHGSDAVGACPGGVAIPRQRQDIIGSPARPDQASTPAAQLGQARPTLPATRCEGQVNVLGTTGSRPGLPDGARHVLEMEHVGTSTQACWPGADRFDRHRTLRKKRPATPTLRDIDHPLDAPVPSSRLRSSPLETARAASSPWPPNPRPASQMQWHGRFRTESRQRAMGRRQRCEPSPTSPADLDTSSQRPRRSPDTSWHPKRSLVERFRHLPASRPG